MNALNFDSSETAWMDRALCVGMDPEEFAPPGEQLPEHVAKVCAQCPVRQQCLQFALDNEYLYGIYGGTTGAQRAQMLGKHHRANKPKVEIPEGTCSRGHAKFENTRYDSIGRPYCGTCMDERATRQIACPNGHDKLTHSFIDKHGFAKCRECQRDRCRRRRAIRCDKGHKRDEHGYIDHLGQNKCHKCDEVKGRKEATGTHCRYGHERAVHGKRGSRGDWRCGACERARGKQRRAKKKLAREQAA